MYIFPSLIAPSNISIDGLASTVARPAPLKVGTTAPNPIGANCKPPLLLTSYDDDENLISTTNSCKSRKKTHRREAWEATDSEPTHIEGMEDDRAQVDLGLAADIEESQMLQAQAAAQDNTTQPDDQEPAVKMPKKRFVGRRAAAEAAAKNGVLGTTGESGALQSEYFSLQLMLNETTTDTTSCSCQAKTRTKAAEPRAARDFREPQAQGRHCAAPCQLQL